MTEILEELGLLPELAIIPQQEVEIPLIIEDDALENFGGKK